MENLKNLRVYLGGAVEQDQNPASWRNTITPHLQQLGMVVLNPLHKPPWLHGIDGPTQSGWKKTLAASNDDHPVQAIRERNHDVREYCLAMIRISDIMIFYIDKTFTVGTFEELTRTADKPTFIISPKEPIVSMWLLDQLGLYTKEEREVHIHPDINSLASMLHRIHTTDFAKKNLNKYKWLFNHLGDIYA